MTKQGLFAISLSIAAAFPLLSPMTTHASENAAVTVAASTAQCAPDSGDTRDMALVIERLRHSLLNPPPDPNAIRAGEAALASLRPDGSWADQDYADMNRERWKAAAHLPRLISITRAYYAPGTPLSGRADVKEKMIASLRYWLKADPKNDNWWHNVIGVPLQIGNLLVLMGDDVPADLKEQGLTLMKRADMSKMTGQNLVWTAQITITRGCLAGDTALVGATYGRMWQEVRWAEKGEEGIQRDSSFHQHGPLIYAGGYGAGFTGDIARFESFARGTKYALPPAKRAILDSYVLDGQQWMLLGGQWDYGVTGRELIRAGKSATGMNAAFALLAADTNDPRHAELANLAAWVKNESGARPPSGNRHYWLSDYMSHRRPDYFASTRMFSTRIANTDGLTNGENKTSHHIADGATYLALTGQEYVGIYPVWDWHRIPGTTVEQDTPLVPNRVRRMGTTKFVGGVSDGTYGAAAMDLVTGQMQAKKAWFYFDREFVCLGAGIDSPTANPVNTTVNQCLLNGPVKTSADPSVADLPHGDRVLSQAGWVWHGNVGYIFPQAETVHVKNDAQTGSLSLLGPWSSTPITKDVFSLWIDHGAHPDEAGYAYVVVPAATAAQTASEAADLPLQIISNTPQTQAVWHRKLQILEAAFRTPGQVSAGGMTVTVDQPCLLLTRREGGVVHVWVSNPENAALTVNVSVEGVAKEGKRQLRFDLPDGLDAGRSVMQQVALTD